MKTHKKYQDDYDRAEDWIFTHDDDVEISARARGLTHEEWQEMTKEEKATVIHDIFYQGVRGYKKSANDLVTAFEAKGNNPHSNIKVLRFKIRGKERIMIYDMDTKRFKQKVK